MEFFANRFISKVWALIGPQLALFWILLKLGRQNTKQSQSISGSVKGNIYSADNLELTKGAVVTGDVFYNLIEMSMGSKIDGNLKHSTVSAKVEQISSASPVISADKP